MPDIVLCYVSHSSPRNDSRGSSSFSHLEVGQLRLREVELFAPDLRALKGWRQS